MSSIAIRGLLTLACTTLVALTATAPARAADDCANAAIRAQQSATHLPDCRAYEMVSPVDKNGYDARRTAGTLRMSTDGDSVTYLGVGAFRGDALGAPILPRYISKRTADGWATRSIDPPLNPEAGILFELFCLLCDLQDPGGFSDDLTKSTVQNYNQALIPGDEPRTQIDLYRRDLVAGSYELLGPASLVAGSLLSYPRAVTATPDHRHVLFETDRNLTPDATGSYTKAYEWSAGELRLVGVLPDGTAAPAGAAFGAGDGDNYSEPRIRSDDVISADGSRIFFAALPRTSDGRLFMRENGGTLQARTVWLSESEKAAPDSPQPARFVGATKDGEKVFFVTGEQLVEDDVDTADDLYRYDVGAPTGTHLTRLSRDEEPAGGVGAGVEWLLGTSADGRRAYFTATSQLVAGEPTDGSSKLYMWEEGKPLRFVATLPGGLIWGGEVSDSDNGNRRFASRNPARVSTDGRYVTFITRNPLTGADQESPKCVGAPCAELFLFDAEASTESIRCLSCPLVGGESAGDIQTVNPEGLIMSPSRYLPRTMVENDGKVRVYFATPNALLPGDGNGRTDVYAYDSVDGRVALISSGRNSSHSYFMDASPDGRSVAIATREGLVGSDRDDLQDIYVATPGGGFAEQSRAPGCQGDSCQGPAAQVPRTRPPSSTSVNGPGDSGGTPRATFSVHSLTGRQRVALARGRRIALVVTTNRAGRVRVVVATKRGRRVRRVASVSRFVRGAGAVKVPLRLSRAARTRLRAGRSSTLVLSVRFAEAPPRRLELRLGGSK